MSRDGYLPPGCTQQDCDEAQPGYWDEPVSEADQLADHIDDLAQLATSDDDWAEIYRLMGILATLGKPVT